MQGGREKKRRGEGRRGGERRGEEGRRGETRAEVGREEEGRGETKGKRQADTHFIQFFFNIYASHTAGYY